MNLEMQNEIRRYFDIPKRIERLQNTVDGVRKDFYSTRTFTSHSQFFEDQWVLLGFRVEPQVLKMIGCIEGKERDILKLEDKKRYFSRFIDGLTQSDQMKLRMKYECDQDMKICELEARAYEEIQEIEEAICHKYGYPVEPDDVTEQSVDDVAEILGV